MRQCYRYEQCGWKYEPPADWFAIVERMIARDMLWPEYDQMKSFAAYWQTNPAQTMCSHLPREKDGSPDDVVIFSECYQFYKLIETKKFEQARSSLYHISWRVSLVEKTKHVPRTADNIRSLISIEAAEEREIIERGGKKYARPSKRMLFLDDELSRLLISKRGQYALNI